MISPAHGLEEEYQAGHALLKLLEQEQTALVNADVESLTKLTEEKARIAAHMSQLAKNRHQALDAAGFETTETGMQNWLASSQANAASNKTWNELLEIVRSAKELNRVNGMLISQHMARNQSALSVLYGNSQGGNLYGPDGQATTKVGSRRLVVG